MFPPFPLGDVQTDLQGGVREAVRRIVRVERPAAPVEIEIRGVAVRVFSERPIAGTGIEQVVERQVGRHAAGCRQGAAGVVADREEILAQDQQGLPRRRLQFGQVT